VLSLASNETHIQLVLRNPLDTQSAKPPGVAMAGLFGAPELPPAPPTRPRVVVTTNAPKAAAKAEPAKAVEAPVFHIEIFNGAQRSEARFAHPIEEKQ